MNILFLQEERVTSGIDGHSTYLISLCNELRKRNHNIFIIYDKNNAHYKSLITRKFNTTLLDISSKNLKKVINIKHVNLIRNEILKLINDNLIDYVHCSSIENLYFLPKKPKLKISVNQHAAEQTNKNKFLIFFLENTFRNFLKYFLKLYLFNYNKADKIVCSGQKAKTTLLNNYNVKNKKIYTFFNAPDLNLSDLKNIRKELGISNSKFLIIGIGRIQHDKGVEDFCKIAKKFSHNKIYKFIYIGPEKNPIYSKNLFSKYKAYVDFLGPRDDIANLLYTSDIFLFLSHRESYPLVLLEAFSIPILSITWNVVGCDEIIIDGTNGYSVPFNDFDALEKTIEHVRKNPRKSNNLKLYAKKMSEEHSIEKLTDLYCSNIFI